MGAATIPVTFKEESRLKTLMMSFMVVKLLSAYNAIIGQPTLNRLKAVASTYQRLMKFPTRAGVDEKRADAHLWTLAYKKVVAKLYNHRVLPRLIKAGDLVLRKAEVSDPTRSRGKLAPN
ncbi:hypothetical protein B296_00006880 [Ensete ventricosum]|uniref:Uncharacterized protein n=1 Tax=Ensete ventricosum TaxID=4639 RepID=A0A427AL23_ENSVE|nr:hypothetical protein B296_00006880 [Ensete ventricosum]